MPSSQLFNVRTCMQSLTLCMSMYVHAMMYICAVHVFSHCYVCTRYFMYMYNVQLCTHSGIPPSKFQPCVRLYVQSRSYIYTLCTLFTNLHNTVCGSTQVWSLASSDDSSWLASGGADSLLCFWKVQLLNL